MHRVHDLCAGEKGDDILRQRAPRVDRAHFFASLFCRKKLLILYKMFIFKNDLIQNTDLTEGRKEEGVFPKGALRRGIGECGEKEKTYCKSEFFCIECYCPKRENHIEKIGKGDHV